MNRKSLVSTLILLVLLALVIAVVRAAMSHEPEQKS
jgi:hypothetical protein